MSPAALDLAPKNAPAADKPSLPGRQNTPPQEGAQHEFRKAAPTNLFSALEADNDGGIFADTVIDALQRQGIQDDDPRIASSLRELRAQPGTMTQARCADLFRENFTLVERAIRDDFVIPRFYEFQEEIGEIFESCTGIRGGAVANYIPQLAQVDPEQFAVSVTTVDGQRAAFGDCETPYCVQSSCKPINYAIALEERGEKFVHRHVGREPSGRSFNELALNASGLPHNPMINAGAIMSCSMIRPKAPLADRFVHVMDTWKRLAGGSSPGFNNPVFLSEKATADRNFALAYFMQEKGAFPKRTNLLETLDFYFQACSIEVTARNMSMIAATLANGGVCPVTNDRVFSNDTVKNCLSLMYSCGMYDFSGEFAFTIGLPAKSCVSGALMVVVPQVMGFAIWSPRLDALGNSVRGVAFCRELVKRFSLHNYDSLLNQQTKRDPARRDAQHRGDQVYQLINAASLGDIDELSRLIAQGADINAADYDGRSPLHLAASEGRKDAAAFLVAKNANCAAKDRWGATPLDDAKRHNHADLFELLVTPPQSGERMQ